MERDWDNCRFVVPFSFLIFGLSPYARALVVVQFEHSVNLALEKDSSHPLGMTTTYESVISNEVRDLSLTEPLPERFRV
jgi:hypothetical protein